MYEDGAYVYPVDVPGCPLCRVAESESLTTSRGALQILRLRPVERARDPSVFIVTSALAVRPAGPEALGR